MKAWLDKLTETFLTSGYYKLMLEGLGNTVIITLGAWSSAWSSVLLLPR